MSQNFCSSHPWNFLFLARNSNIFPAISFQKLKDDYNKHFVKIVVKCMQSGFEILEFNEQRHIDHFGRFALVHIDK
jgi:hypothetical protein